MMREPSPKRRHNRRVDYAVDVGLSFCRKAGMKIIGSLFRPQNAYVAPQVSVDRGLEFIGSELAVDEHIRDLSLGVDARVGSPGPDHADLCVVEHPDDALELALDSAVIFLHLPSVKVGAVVLDEKFVVQGSCQSSVVSLRSPGVRIQLHDRS